MDTLKQRGLIDPKLQGRGDYKDLTKVPCCHESEEHIAAEQIFPLIKTEYWYTPTIKHHCPRTALASSLRACSNKVWYDQKVYDKYAEWFRTKFIPEFVKCMDQEIVEVDFDKWLERFPLQYRSKMRVAIDRDHVSSKIDKRYEAFTKVEMQFTTTQHADKETSENDVKERQICNPVDEKKICANPFINILEGIASKHFKPYCGRANWVEICAALDDVERDMGDHVWGASDGSGFDMTQYPAMNQLMNELIETCARHKNVVWKEPLTIDRLIEVLKLSMELDVSVDHGDLKYHAVGRASGDGWTTFGNTMLMISYWMFTFHCAGITKYGLKVKGDDVLFCLLKSQLPQFHMAVSYVFTTSKDLHRHGLGQICKKIDFGELTELDFLSNEFFLTSEGKFRMTRIPARVIQTNSWTTKMPKNVPSTVVDEIRRELCYSKGKCLEAWASGLPIFGLLAQKMITLGKPGKHTTFDVYADADRTWHKDRDDYDAYLYYLETRYNITAPEVRKIEKEIASISELSGYMELPELEKLYNRS